MDGGYVGSMSRIVPDYRCYILFLPNLAELEHAAEDYVTERFWKFASSVGEDVLFTGVTRGDGLRETRQKFGIVKPTDAVFLILDTSPEDWVRDMDPLVCIHLPPSMPDSEVDELLRTLVDLSAKENFIGKVKRKQTMDSIKQKLEHLPSLGSAVRAILPWVR